MSARRPLFVAAVFAGSFLLFMVQPMVARAALPRLGGAPAVWNSAMLVYQALLLAGYGYAHWLGRWSLRRQATVHLALLVLAALTLPVHLANLPAPAPGWEALWVPALFAVSVGPVFFAVSAQAPLLQRWFASDARAGDPYALYAASNLGSFAGLLSYPLVVEPLLPLGVQTWAWSAGYGLLVVLVVLTAWARWRIPAALVHPEPAEGRLLEPHQEQRPARVLRQAQDERRGGIGWRTFALWLGLSAVPSGLMLSTTTHLTTDVFAMPLLWVIPLGLYLLSFVVAFAERRGLAGAVGRSAAPILLLAGGLAMNSRGTGSLAPALAGVVMLFVVATALHARLHALRPTPDKLTLFYFVMSAGGALGGLFAALIAPLVFDWVWEHPLLVLAAALLIPQVPLLGWMRLPGMEPGVLRGTVITIVLFAAFLCWLLADVDPAKQWLPGLLLSLSVAFCGVLVLGRRWAFVTVLVLTMLARGGIETIEGTQGGLRTRSYFGIYTVRDFPSLGQRTLSHGTTMHGLQFTDPARARIPTSYYGPTSGIGLALESAAPDAHVGVVGFGTATSACFKQPAQRWTFFEIDPAVVALSKERHLFTYLDRCAPGAAIRIGDARLELALQPPATFDVLAVDAFSSDAIPLHLMTAEAFAVYARALKPDGVLLVHISNRYIDLEPVVFAIGNAGGWSSAMRSDVPQRGGELVPSFWIALAKSPQRLAALAKADPAAPWDELNQTPTPLWTDDRSSILPHIRWANIVGGF